MFFPRYRLRRTRRTEGLRALVRETDLAPRQFLLPLFLRHGSGLREPIASLPGIATLSPDTAADEAAEAVKLGLGGVLLFGLPARKDAVGSEAFDDEGIVQRTIRAIKQRAPVLPVATDVCLCEYTDHGHCGVVKDGAVQNDASLPLLARTAVSHARAGADVIAPSDMMDGRVAAIRASLDAAGFSDTPILSYAVKYASAFYGPFRDAVGSAPQFGDRRGYQMDPPNAEEALREIRLDIEEGADMVMIKPALSYLDVIRRAKTEFHYPLAAYNVSGEYVMVKSAAAAGALDEKRAVLEILTSIRRAGADLIVTYHAKDAARWLREG